MNDRTTQTRKEKTMNNDGWEQGGEIANRNSGGVSLRLLNDGEAFVRFVRRTPFAAERHWLNANDRQPTRTPKGGKRAAKGRAR